jgi:hypothetical protein
LPSPRNPKRTKLGRHYMCTVVICRQYFSMNFDPSSSEPKTKTLLPFLSFHLLNGIERLEQAEAVDALSSRRVVETLYDSVTADQGQSPRPDIRTERTSQKLLKETHASTRAQLVKPRGISLAKPWRAPSLARQRNAKRQSQRGTIAELGLAHWKRIGSLPRSARSEADQKRGSRRSFVDFLEADFWTG